VTRYTQRLDLGTVFAIVPSISAFTHHTGHSRRGERPRRVVSERASMWMRVHRGVQYTEAPVAIRSYNVDVMMSGCRPVVAELELGRAGLAMAGVPDPDDPNRQHEHTLLVCPSTHRPRPARRGAGQTTRLLHC
jgi:hypothetical protein